MIGIGVNDSVEGERIVCVCHRIAKQRVVVGSHAHRALELVLEGTPVKCFVLKPLRSIH